MRAIWKGDLTIGAEHRKAGAIHVPVKLYSAVEDRAVHFHLLHKSDGVRVKQRMVDPSTGAEVALDQVQHGYPVDGGLVRLSDDDLVADEPEPSRTISVATFVPAAAIDVGWYARPYFLGPDGDEPGYAALVAALTDSGRRGIAHWVMRKSRQRGALEARDGRLVLITLRSAEEVVPASDLSRPAGPAVSAGERGLAEQLVASLDATFDPAAFPDEYQARVREFIAAKAHGKKLHVKAAAPPRPTGDIADALRASLARATKPATKPAAKSATKPAAKKKVRHAA